MINPEKDISNLDFPIANVVRQALYQLTEDNRRKLLGQSTEDEFISLRVDVYLEELEAAMHAGYDELGAKEIALNACLYQIKEDDGAVLEA